MAQCCAIYKKRIPGMPSWKWPSVRCTHEHGYFRISTDGRSITRLCGVHRNADEMEWMAIDDTDLDDDELEHLIEVLQHHIKRCEENADRWIQERLATIERLQSLLASKQKDPTP
jgi:hypothetical protein